MYIQQEIIIFSKFSQKNNINTRFSQLPATTLKTQRFFQLNLTLTHTHIILCENEFKTYICILLS
jgi:hypothetical protein